MTPPKPRALPNIRIVGINGSPVRGICRRLLSTALRSAQHRGADTELVDLPVPLDLKHLRTFDGLILASPVHWFNASALMLQFLAELTLAGCADPPWPLEGMASLTRRAMTLTP